MRPRAVLTAPQPGDDHGAARVVDKRLAGETAEAARSHDGKD